MRKFWLVFSYEYRYHVFRWKFLGTLLTLPLYFLFMAVIGAAALWASFDHSPIGIVDQAAFFGPNLPSTNLNARLPFLAAQFQRYPSQNVARAALDAQQINAYYVFPPDFWQNRRIEVFYTRKPEAAVQSQIEQMVLIQYLSRYSPERASLLTTGLVIISQSVSAADTPQAKTSLAITRLIIPILAVFFVMGSLSNATGYLSRAIADEKANRTIEILVTSVSPEQLMVGKIAALVSVALTALFFWFSGPGLLAAAAAINGLHLDKFYPGGLGMMMVLLLMALPTLLLFAALVVMVTVGFADPREGQQFAFLVNLLNMVPFLLMSVVMLYPDGKIALVLSFLPITAATTLMMRAAFTTLPAWQIAAGWLSLLVGTGLAFWLTAKVFRASMLRFGGPLLGRSLINWLRKWVRFSVFAGPRQASRPLAEGDR